MRNDKHKKGLVIVLLLIAVLVLGVGYAAITSVTLDINGQAAATSDDENFDVNFVGTPSFDKMHANTDATIVAAISDVHNATIQVTNLKKVGDYVTATYDIENVSPEEIIAELSANVSNSNSTYFDVSYEFEEDAIAKGEQTTITVKVELKKVVVGDDQTADIEVAITATPQE